MAITVRTFQAADYQAVNAIWTSAGLSLNVSDELSELLKTTERDPQLFMVAESEHQVVGAVLARYDGRRANIYHLAVLPSQQGQGIGKLLMYEVVQRLRAVGCKKVNLHVAPSNLKVAPFYEGLGFKSEELHYMTKWII